VVAISQEKTIPLPLISDEFSGATQYLNSVVPPQIATTLLPNTDGIKDRFARSLIILISYSIKR
jgi:hypothetical protein